MALQMSATDENGVTVVKVIGRIASDNASDFGDFMRDTIIHSAGGQLVLDMGGLDYLSSAGLREIVAALKLTKKNGGDLRMAAVSERLRMLLDIAGLPTFTDIFDRVDQAVASYR